MIKLEGASKLHLMDLISQKEQDTLISILRNIRIHLKINEHILAH